MKEIKNLGMMITGKWMRMVFLSLVIFYHSAINAQDWIGTGVHTNMVRRDGNVFIGLTSGSSKLHVYAPGPNGQMTVCGQAPSIRFNEGDGGNQNEDRACIGLATAATHYFSSANSNDMILRANTTTGNILLGTGLPSVERMRIASNGSVGIGTSSPITGKLLHIRGANPTLYLDAISGNPGIEYASGATVLYTITHTPGTAGGQMKIGPNGTLYKSLHFRPAGAGVLVFSNSPTFGYTGFSGLSGNYIFDSQVSTTSLMVAPAGPSGSYPTIQGGALFNVQGSSYLNGLFQINNSADLDPVSVTGNGITMGSSTNTITGPPAIGPYSWIQTDKLRPLALNPIPDGNPTNTSYVAIGFIPGTYNVPLNYKLAVKGKIICEELKVKYAGIWSDYVFEKDYKLRNLKEVEQFITENKHLPDVPSAGEIKEQGIEAGQMDATLLKKIEELTLYVIDQNKKMEEMKGIIKEMDTEIQELKKQKNRSNN